MIVSEIDADTFHADVRWIESLWQPLAMPDGSLLVIDVGDRSAEPLVFIPILEHLEFVYACQLRSFSEMRRVILYRRHESRTKPVGLAERADELRNVLDALRLGPVDLVGHGDAAMVLFEFATRYPERCRSLIIVAQGADYQIAPHPFIWLLHELFVRLPVEHVLPAWWLRRIVINYIVASKPSQEPAPDPGPVETSSAGPVPTADRPPPVRMLPRSLIEEQFHKIDRWPFVYKFSVLPIIHYFDLRDRLGSLRMPILLINRADDALSPEYKTRRLAEQLPACAGYHVIPGGERFFMYGQAEAVNAIIERFLMRIEKGEVSLFARDVFI